jgi:hypothetical protein
MCCITPWDIPPARRMVPEWICSPNIEHLRYCSVFGVDQEGNPSCLIYDERPRVCRDFVCDKTKVIDYIKHFKYQIR